jgi:RNase P subunit RPR2
LLFLHITNIINIYEKVKWFIYMINKNNIGKTKKKIPQNEEYKYCPSCGEKYPDSIISRIETFKFRLSITCPNCNYHSELYESI